MTGPRPPFEFVKVTLPPGFAQAFEENLVLAGNRRQAIRALHGWESGVCWLCGDLVDVDLPHPHPGSGVIDHVEPKVLGGKLVRENVHLAHFQCNSLRRELPPETYTQDEYRAALVLGAFRYEHPDIYWRDQVTELTAKARSLGAQLKSIEKELDAVREAGGPGARDCRAAFGALATEMEQARKELGYVRALLSHAKERAAAYGR